MTQEHHTESSTPTRKTPRRASAPDPTNEGARFHSHQRYATVLRELRAPQGANNATSGHFLAETPMCGFFKVTKELAALLLGWVAINRAIDERNMVLIKSQMELDLWLVTGDAVQVDTKGNVFEGQHRLLAIFVTGRAQTLLIAWGLPPSAAHVGSDPKPKTLRDALIMADIPDATRKSSWITAMEAVLGRKQGRVSRALGLMYNTDFNRELTWMSSIAPKSAPWCRAAVLAGFIIAYRREPKATEAFAMRVLHNVGKPGGKSVAGLLRSYLISIGPQDHVRGYVITCTVLNAILAYVKRAAATPLGGTPEGLTYFTKYEGFEQKE